MTTKTALFSFSTDRETVVYERVRDSQWTAKLEAWRAAYRAVRTGQQYDEGRGSSYLSPVIPSVLPWGHIEFDRRRKNGHAVLDTMPQPIWSDGIACCYEGQRVGWRTMFGEWFYGHVVGVENIEQSAISGNAGGPMLLVTKTDGGTCLISPYKIS